MSDSNKTRTTQQAIIDFNSVHGDRYDYSKYQYLGSNKKGIVICKMHGEFTITYHHHFHRKQNCQLCSKNAKQTTKSTIIAIMKIHGLKYGCDKVEYTKAKEKIKLFCKRCESYFMITPDSVKQGKGCITCGNERGSSKNRTKYAEFVRKANARHNGVYSYTDSGYKNLDSLVKILCSEHGYFYQRAGLHLHGNGCKLCAYRRSVIKIDGLREVVLSKFNGDINIIDSDYENGESEILANCAHHGEFKTKPNYLRICKFACPVCASMHRSTFKIKSYISNCNKTNNGVSNIYLIRMSNGDESFFKVGITKETIKSRFRQQEHYEIEVIHFSQGKARDVFNKEKQILKLVKPLRYNPKVKFGGYTECFSEIPDGLFEILYCEDDEHIAAA